MGVLMQSLDLGDDARATYMSFLENLVDDARATSAATQTIPLTPLLWC
jgi:hypothetical protein